MRVRRAEQVSEPPGYSLSWLVADSLVNVCNKACGLAGPRLAGCCALVCRSCVSEVFVERAARSHLVEALSGCGVAGDGTAECLGGRLIVTVGSEHGAASLGGRWGQWAAVPQASRTLDTGEEGGPHER